MKIILFVISILFSSTSFSQSDSAKVVADSAFKVPVEAQFPGGVKAWAKYLRKNLNTKLGEQYIVVPPGQKSAIQTVVVSFMVDTDGTVTDVKADNADQVHPMLAAEAVRVIKEGPKWIPPPSNGQTLRFRQRQSISWVVSEE